jgi:predicted TIM-barrel fold metal-dependent hydrolase
MTPRVAEPFLGVSSKPGAKMSAKHVAITLCTLMAGVASVSIGQDIAYKEDPDAAKPMTLLLKDFEPHAMVHLAVREVPRAKFPAIDFHNHVNDAQRINGENVSPAEVVANMDRANIKSIVILTGLWGEKLQAVLDNMVKPYPGRFVALRKWTGARLTNCSSAPRLQQLKVLKDLGLGVRDKTGKLVAIDDERMDPVWEECGRLGIPVAIHSTDPEAFFTPPDKHNERYEELLRNPTWSFCGADFPTKEKLLEERNHVFEKHPRTNFVALHLANWPENLDAVSRWLKKYPNMSVEVGAREAELGRQPRRARQFFMEFQDRILFGTDSEPDPKMYANYFRWLETADEYFEYWGYPGQGRWDIYGMELPDEVLEKVYHKNAERIFAQFKGIAKVGD